MLSSKIHNALDDSSNAPTKESQSQSVDDFIAYTTPRSELAQTSTVMPQVDSSSTNAATQTEKEVSAGKKLSAAGANASLYKKANPKDLPSWPSQGGMQNLEASAGRAALLAAQSSKSPELWKPDKLPAAGAAASLATSVRSPEPWNPGPLPAASAAAALAKDHPKSPEAWQPGAPSTNASLAANHVKDNKSPETWKPTVGPNSHTAARIANSPASRGKSVERPRSNSGATYDINKLNQVATANAQNRLSTASPPMPQATQDRNMSDVLRAASMSMAKKPAQSSSTEQHMPSSSFYSHLPTTTSHVEATPSSASAINRRSSLAAASIAASHDRSLSPATTVTTDRTPKYYPHLEEAARKAAAERLARLQAEHDNHRKASGLPSTWTTPASPSSSVRAAAGASDAERSRKIKSDTAKLQQQMDAVDREKAANDHVRLLALAEANVKKRMDALEIKVANDQGRVPKHMQEEWTARAKILSEENEAKRAAEKESKKGKIDMGGGLWYDQEDLERIARGNVQPILDEISEKAAAQRAKEEQIRLEKAEAERQKKIEHERQAETKAEIKKAKAVEKAEKKAKDDELKAQKAEEREAERKHAAELKAAERERREQHKAILAAEQEGQKKQEEFDKSLTPGAISEQTDDAARAERAHEEYDAEMAAVQEIREERMQNVEPRPVSRDAEPVAEQKEKKSWFESIGRRLSRKDKKEKDTPVTKDKISAPVIVDEHNKEDHSAVSSEDEEDHDAETPSLRDVALAGAVSPVSDDGFELVDNKRKGVYVPSSSSSSSSSTDLYKDDFKDQPLTAATYNPTEAGGNDMPEFVPRDSETTSVSSLAEETPAPVHVADHDSPTPPASTTTPTTSEPHTATKRQQTFGEMLMKPFSGFSKKEVAAEEQEEKAHQHELKAPEEGAANVGHVEGLLKNRRSEDNEGVKLDHDAKSDDEFSEARDEFDESGGGLQAGQGVRKIGNEEHGRTSKFKEEV